MKKYEIKVILWDIDGTLLNFEESEKNAIRKCFSIFNLGECSDTMLKDYSRINKEYWQRLERGELSKKEVLENRFHDFFNMYGLDTNVVPDFNMEYQIRLGDTIVFYEDGLQVVKDLKGKILQYAVTNGTRLAQERKLKKSGLDQLLDGIFISETVGIEKPMAGFFHKVLGEIEKVELSEIMIIGDSLTSDMQGGINAGIVTCWFNPEKKENQLGIKTDYEIYKLKEVYKIT